jgi:pimeloyl-ACP methyl ester carboxylesterase
MRSRSRSHRGAFCHWVVWGGALALVSLLLPGCGRSSTDTSSTEASPTGLVLESCTVDGVPARCGTLTVPEDRLSGSGRQIPIRVVVIPATDPHRQSDPIVWFAGGPGDSAVETISRVRPLLAANTDRDLVFVEQRGTGASNVTCPAFPDSSDKAALQSAIESCLASLHADLRFYTTAMFADDVDEVLSDLHYEKANLVGISYGTTGEQVFSTRHPDRVRTMTLLSGTLLAVPVFERFPENAQRALGLVFDECERAPACQQAFPALRADWTALWSSVSASPWVVPADQSPTGTEVSLDSSWVASKLHDLLLVATTHTRIPLLVHTLGATEDRVAALLAVTQAYPESPGTGSSEQQMLPYAIRCNEAWARDDPTELVGTDSFEYGRDLSGAQWWQEVCKFIPKADEAAATAESTKSDVSVVAFNGEEDPQDPPGNMAGAQETWPNILALTVPGQGHDIDPVSAGCEIPLIKSFIEQGDVAGLDATCLSQLPLPSFDLTLGGG